jgi:GNAT superfamily N-acetyltransferase
MAHVAATPTDIRVAPATTPSDWCAGRILVGQLVTWLGTLGLDVRRQQHDSNAELDALEEFYRAPNGRLLLGFVDERACGTTGVHLLSPDTAELRRVWVTPDARGHGLASRLLQAGIEAARSLGARSMWLETVDGHMDTAIGMYRRAGFQPIRPYTSLGESLPNAVSLGLVLTPR